MKILATYFMDLNLEYSHTQESKLITNILFKWLID